MLLRSTMLCEKFFEIVVNLLFPWSHVTRCHHTVMVFKDSSEAELWPTGRALKFGRAGAAGTGRHVPASLPVHVASQFPQHILRSVYTFGSLFP